MDVQQYLIKYKDAPEKIQRLADRSGTKVVYLRQLGSEFRGPGPRLALLLHQLTDGELHVMHTRPDYYPPFLFSAHPGNLPFAVVK